MKDQRERIRKYFEQAEPPEGFEKRLLALETENPPARKKHPYSFYLRFALAAAMFTLVLVVGLSLSPDDRLFAEHPDQSNTNIGQESTLPQNSSGNADMEGGILPTAESSEPSAMQPSETEKTPTKTEPTEPQPDPTQSPSAMPSEPPDPEQTDPTNPSSTQPPEPSDPTQTESTEESDEPGSSGQVDYSYYFANGRDCILLTNPTTGESVVADITHLLIDGCYIGWYEALGMRSWIQFEKYPDGSYFLLVT